MVEHRFTIYVLSEMDQGEVARVALPDHNPPNQKFTREYFRRAVQMLVPRAALDGKCLFEMADNYHEC